VENWGQENLQFTVGEPVTRTLMLFADGLTSAQLPEIESALPEGLKQYPDQPLLRDRENPDGITGIREFKVAIVPSRSGRFTLPAININWWNVDTRRMETASIPQQQIEVLPAIGGEIQSAPVKDAVTSQPQQQAPTAISSNANTHYPWLQALTIFFGLGWFGTALAWRYNTKKKPAAKPIEAPIPGKSGKADMRVLRAACLANEPVAAGKALLKWGVSQWPDSPPATITSTHCTPIPGLSRTVYGYISLGCVLSASEICRSISRKRSSRRYPGNALFCSSIHTSAIGAISDFSGSGASPSTTALMRGRKIHWSH